MKKCKCGADIDDKYSMCLTCLDKIKQSNSSIDTSEILKKLEQMNWNLGSISQTLKLTLLNDLEKDATTQTQKKIHNALLKECDKYLKVLKDIREEQENK